MEFGFFDWIDTRPAPLLQGSLRSPEADRIRRPRWLLLLPSRRTSLRPNEQRALAGLFLSAVAQRTRRIHFGPLCYMLPLYTPARLIEEICMLDHLSGGRLEVGVGRGIVPFELAFAGVDPNRRRRCSRSRSRRSSPD